MKYLLFALVLLLACQKEQTSKEDLVSYHLGQIEIMLAERGYPGDVREALNQAKQDLEKEDPAVLEEWVYTPKEYEYISTDHSRACTGGMRVLIYPSIPFVQGWFRQSGNCAKVSLFHSTSNDFGFTLPSVYCNSSSSNMKMEWNIPSSSNLLCWTWWLECCSPFKQIDADYNYLNSGWNPRRIEWSVFGGAYCGSTNESAITFICEHGWGTPAPPSCPYM